MKLPVVLFLLAGHGHFALGYEYQLRGLKSSRKWQQWIHCDNAIVIDRGGVNGGDDSGRRRCMKRLEKKLKNQLNADLQIQAASDRYELYKSDIPPEQCTHSDKRFINIYDCNNKIIEETLDAVANACLHRRHCGSIQLIKGDFSNDAYNCAKVIQAQIEGNYQLDVNFDTATGATAENYTKYMTRWGLESQLYTLYIDKYTQCNRRFVDQVFCDVENEIWRALPSPLARACGQGSNRSFNCNKSRRGTTRNKMSKSESTKSSKSIRIKEKKSRNRTTCDVPHYQALSSPAECKELTQQGHVNSYWFNKNFLCRTNERPCNATGMLEMVLGNGMVLRFDTLSSQGDLDSSEVWQVRTDKYGNQKMFPWKSRYRFWSEGHWYKSEVGQFDVNDYCFGSLECFTQDSDDFFFIIVDGVLVDSCPKSLAEHCRACSA